MKNIKRFIMSLFSILSKKAFSFLELLLVVLLIGILAGFAIPNLSGSYSQFLLNETARNVSSLMRYAQSQSVVSAQEYRLQFSSDNSSYWLEKQLKNDDVLLNKRNFKKVSGRWGSVRVIPEDISVNSEKPFTLFYPDGTIEKTRIYFKNSKGKSMTVSTQEQRGRVHVF